MARIKQRGIRPAYHPRKGFKDDAKAGKALDAINREYLDKEADLRKSVGPLSLPAESHYEKSFKVKSRKE